MGATDEELRVEVGWLVTGAELLLLPVPPPPPVEPDPYSGGPGITYVVSVCASLEYISTMTKGKINSDFRGFIFKV